MTAHPTAHADADPARIVDYHVDPLRWLNSALLGVFFGLVFLGTVPPVGAALLGISLTALAFIWWRRHSPGTPLMSLSPAGVTIGFIGLRDKTIPWSEIVEIETESFTVGSGKRKARFEDVTMVLVSEEFYLQDLHVESTFKRGPGWDTVFRRKGDLYQVALHHEPCAIRPEDVRNPVEKRWQAFRYTSSPIAPREQFGRSAAIRVYGGQSALLTRWRPAISLALLAAIGFATIRLVSG